MPSPYKPFVPTAGAIGRFDFGAIARELRDDEAFEKSGRVARTLARSDELTAVLTVIAKGTELHEHTAPGPAIVTVLSGNVQLAFEGSGGEFALRQGESVVFAKDASHRVRALDDSSFLMVIGGRLKA
jgi:quercetin dioxygenase-like cupin family protein